MKQDIFQAIADPTRRAILTLIAMSGREIYYYFNPKKMQEIDNWLAQFRKIWETQFNQLDKVLLTILHEQKK